MPVQKLSTPLALKKPKSLKAMHDSQLIFLKLGGSLISQKDQADTARLELIHALLGQISAFIKDNPDQKILLGHGSGSFGHMPARVYGTRDGVYTPTEWAGYQEVWWHARQLNQIVLELGTRLSLPLLSFPPSAMVITRQHVIQTWDTQPIQSALEHGIIPLVYGDVVTDLAIGGTILSTEDLFLHLARQFKPARVLLAGIEEGVFADYPKNQVLLKSIPANARLDESVTTSGFVDVTGGMRAKLVIAQQICLENPGTEVRIFSATNPDQMRAALEGEPLGTLIHYANRPDPVEHN